MNRISTPLVAAWSLTVLGVVLDVALRPDALAPLLSLGLFMATVWSITSTQREADRAGPAQSGRSGHTLQHISHVRRRIDSHDEMMGATRDTSDAVGQVQASVGWKQRIDEATERLKAADNNNAVAQSALREGEIERL